jgi:hypothetical protein
VLKDGDAVHFRHAHIQQDQIGVIGLRAFQALLPIFGFHHRIAIVPERRIDQQTKVGIVIHDKNT